MLARHSVAVGMIDVMREFLEKNRRRGWAPSVCEKFTPTPDISGRRLNYVSRKRDEELVALLKELAAAHPRYGCRRMWALLRCEGRLVNLKYVRWLYRKHDLVLKQKRRRQASWHWPGHAM